MNVDAIKKGPLVLALSELIAEYLLTQDDPDLAGDQKTFAPLDPITISLTGLHFLVKDNVALLSIKNDEGELDPPLAFIKVKHPAGGDNVILALNPTVDETWEAHPPQGLVISDEFAECVK